MFETQPPVNLPTPKDAEDIFAHVDTGGASKDPRSSAQVSPIEEKAGFRVSPKPFIIGGVVLVVIIAAVTGVVYAFNRAPKSATTITPPPSGYVAPTPQVPPPSEPIPPPTPQPEAVAPAVVAPLDTDNDGVTDAVEIELGTNPNLADTDGDGLTDNEEVNIYNTDPLKVDTDGDGLSDKEEVKIYSTDPRNPDTDGDTYPDGLEVKNGYDPKGLGKLLAP